MKELELVVLERDVPEHGLARGDVGTIVHAYRQGRGYEVEFILGSGETVAVLTLGAGDVRPRGEHEILHTRTLG